MDDETSKHPTPEGLRSPAPCPPWRTPTLANAHTGERHLTPVCFEAFTRQSGWLPMLIRDSGGRSGLIGGMGWSFGTRWGARTAVCVMRIHRSRQGSGEGFVLTLAWRRLCFPWQVSSLGLSLSGSSSTLL